MPDDDPIVIPGQNMVIPGQNHGFWEKDPEHSLAAEVIKWAVTISVVLTLLVGVIWLFRLTF